MDGDEYFIDLLLFRGRLKALVAIELKVGKFIPEFVGKMQFYLRAIEKPKMAREKRRTSLKEMPEREVPLTWLVASE